MIKSRMQRHRRAFINHTIAPKNFIPAEHRMTGFARLLQLLKHFPLEYVNEFVMLNDLWERFQYHANFQETPLETCIGVANFLRKNQLLTEAPYLAAICSNRTMTHIEHDKYDFWRSLIILCCLQLHIIGQHEASNQAALREIRLIATEPAHRPILKFLPNNNEFCSLHELNEKLKKLRENDYPAIQSRGLGYLQVVLHDAINKNRGILRIKGANYTPAVIEKIELVSRPSMDETNLQIYSLSATIDTPAEDNDESTRLQPTLTLRLHDPDSRNKSQILAAIHGRRLTEQLASRQKSLACSYEQASDWDIKCLIQTCVTRLQNNEVEEDAAALLLLSLLQGQNQIQLLINNLATAKNHPLLKIEHQVPASCQPELTHKLLGTVRPYFIIPLPGILFKWVSKLTERELDESTIDTKNLLAHINTNFKTRLSLGRIGRYMEHWMINHGVDRATIALLRGETHKERPALAYQQFRTDAVLDTYYQYVQSIFNAAECEPCLPQKILLKTLIGSQLRLPVNVLHNWFCLLATNIPKLTNEYSQIPICAFHNQFVAYVWALLAFTTGHRDVNAPMGKLTDYNRHHRTWWISDKEIRHGLAARTVILPETAARQVDLYVQHLQELCKRTRYISPQIAARCEQSLAGETNLLFAIGTGQEPIPVPTDLTPSLLQTMLDKQIFWPRNWGRHHLRSELVHRGISPEQVDGWMGHEDLGEEALGQHSFISMADRKDIAAEIESILQEHQIEAIAGWQIH